MVLSGRYWLKMKNPEASAVKRGAQGVYIGPGGVGIDTGRPAYRERYYRGDRSDRSYAYERGRFGGCRTVTIERDDGSVRRVRRCD
jgi:hypothetical protein